MNVACITGGASKPVATGGATTQASDGGSFPVKDGYTNPEIAATVTQWVFQHIHWPIIIVICAT